MSPGEFIAVSVVVCTRNEAAPVLPAGDALHVLEEIARAQDLACPRFLYHPES